jgi:hypothetical protein
LRGEEEGVEGEEPALASSSSSAKRAARESAREEEGTEETEGGGRGRVVVGADAAAAAAAAAAVGEELDSGLALTLETPFEAAAAAAAVEVPLSRASSSPASVERSFLGPLPFKPLPLPQPAAALPPPSPLARGPLLLSSPSRGTTPGSDHAVTGEFLCVFFLGGGQREKGERTRGFSLARVKEFLNVQRFHSPSPLFPLLSETKTRAAHQRTERAQQRPARTSDWPRRESRAMAAEGKGEQKRRSRL